MFSFNIFRFYDFLRIGLSFLNSKNVLCLIERVAVSYLVQEVVRGGCAGRLCGILGGCAGRLCGRVFRMHIPLKHMLLFSKAVHFVELS